MLTEHSPIPDILTAAADLLAAHGMYAPEVPDYWDGASDQQIWLHGMAPDPTGAVAVTIGATTGRDVQRLLGHIDYNDPAVKLLRAAGNEPQPAELHPVFRALFTHVGIDPDDELAVTRWFAWCDRQLCHQVIATYRDCATQHARRGVPA